MSDEKEVERGKWVKASGKPTISTPSSEGIIIKYTCYQQYASPSMDVCSGFMKNVHWTENCTYNVLSRSSSSLLDVK